MEETVRVLIVDDSSFFRKRIREQLERHPGIVVAGEARNGREAVEMNARLTPDVVTMDVAMPEMDGITAVREIMRSRPTDIMMISALTREGARSTLDALDAGAVDFLPKHGGTPGDTDSVYRHLAERVIGIAHRLRGVRAPMPQPQPVRPPSPKFTAPNAAVRRRSTDLKLVVIGASTGGPVAIQRVLGALPAGYPYPVLVIVHMPVEFTSTFADRLDNLCAVHVALASDGSALRSGEVLVAPGGSQALVERHGSRLQVAIRPGGEHLYKPSVDITFESAARAVAEGVQAVVLTGMGSDGTEGARMLKQMGASVWTQDQASSVVFGMPYSVAKAGLTDRVLALDEIGPALAGLG
ncbi:MAG: chemotaxis response regulator protein-glutamate methylesterase [Gammaproteobacteria bacterium]|nr:chemotaxis response regulator protein-glutamate methylesterase [Gammaproteobacteria bacterium]MCP5298862.1 chemotaxis response regulator protein-glutamate methylesterase [Chromatiaceae bacterium]